MYFNLSYYFSDDCTKRRCFAVFAWSKTFVPEFLPFSRTL